MLKVQLLAVLGVVDEPEQATRAVLKLSSPSQQLHPNFFFGAFQKEGDLDFKADNEGLKSLEALSQTLPVLVIVEMDRPPIFTNVRDKVALLAAGFGVSDAAVAAVLRDPSLAEGRAPYALPASMAAVLAQQPDLPGDDPDPLYPLRHSAS